SGGLSHSDGNTNTSPVSTFQNAVGDAPPGPPPDHRHCSCGSPHTHSPWTTLTGTMVSNELQPASRQAVCSSKLGHSAGGARSAGTQYEPPQSSDEPQPHSPSTSSQAIADDAQWPQSSGLKHTSSSAQPCSQV